MYELASPVQTERASLIIRPANVEDIWPCSQIDTRYQTDYVWQMHFQEQNQLVKISFNQLRLPRTMSVDYPYSGPELCQFFESASHFLVATYQDQILGCLQGTVDSIGHTFVVDHILVQAEMRRRGIGYALFKAVKALANNHGCRQLAMIMQTKNHPAISLAQKAGLSYSGYNDRHFSNGDIALTFSLKL